MDIQQFRAMASELMAERGWDRAELARQSGLPQSTIYGIFDQETTPSFETFMAIIKAFDIKLLGFEKDTEDYYLHIDRKLLTEQKELIELTCNKDPELIRRILSYA